MFKKIRDEYRYMREFDDRLLEDYKPGVWAPLDMPMGMIGITVFSICMLVFGVVFLSVVLYSVFT